MKIKMKQGLKNNPHLTLKEYDESKPKRRMGSGWWILIGAAGALLLLFIVFAIAFGGQK
jgi:flagellar basal body-associated protein FliL